MTLTSLFKSKYDLPIVILLFGLALLVEYQEGVTIVEDETLSYRHLVRADYGDPDLTAPSQAVTVVYTDEAFYEEYGVYPLRRVDLATIITRLSDMGAAVIGVDMLLDFNSAYGEDPTLVSAIEAAGNVLLVSQAEIDDDRGYQKTNYAIPKFSSIAESGYSNISSNSDLAETMVRLRIHPNIAEQDGEWPFAVKALSMYTGEPPVLRDHRLFMGDRQLATLDQHHDLYLDYPKLPRTLDGAGSRARHEAVGIPAGDILFLDEEELYDLSFLVEGKIVLIGEVAEVAHDQFETPVGNVFGVNIIASEIGTLIKQGPLRAASFGLELLSAGLLLALIAGTTWIAAPLIRNGLSVLGLVVFVVVCFWAYARQGLVLSMVPNIGAWVLSLAVVNGRFYLNEMGQKAYIKEAFGQYLSPTVVADLVADPDKLNLGGEEREMTAYFSDIAGFSTFSESMTPTQLVQLLNEYLTEMCDVIIDSDGTIDKFEGDAIIAFWGAPIDQPAHARQACYASIDMNKALESLRDLWVNRGLPSVSVRMGINTGRMVVGNMGSSQRVNYTIMGDAVNLAARLEGANKAFGSDLMISEATYMQCADDIDVRELDVIRVVGKAEPIRVFQLLDRKNQTSGILADVVDRYHKGLSLIRDRNFVEAEAAFRACVEMMPNDGPSQTHLARCQQFLITPPPSDWDGVLELKEKG
jgi:adenylate cyclase